MTLTESETYYELAKVIVDRSGWRYIRNGGIDDREVAAPMLQLKKKPIENVDPILLFTKNPLTAYRNRIIGKNLAELIPTYRNNEQVNRNLILDFIEAKYGLNRLRTDDKKIGKRISRFLADLRSSKNPKIATERLLR